MSAPDAAKDAAGSERLKVALSWLVVGLPALWGVAQVAVKALALFR